LVNLANAVGGLKLPHMERLGLGNIDKIKGIPPAADPLASYGKMKEISKGKDSTTGHWEIAGLYVDIDFSYYPDGFPETLIKKFLEKTGCKGILGNKAASGTEIINELGDEHIKTGFPIIYTSADSVFQIAAHEEVISPEDLYRICKVTREEVLTPPVLIGRVIARPFTGSSGNYTRTVNRKDFSLDPPSETVLDLLYQNNIATIAIGKVNDLFNYRGISVKEKTRSNAEGCNKLLEYTTKVSNAFVFANLVDFDVQYGHRNDPHGFAEALSEFDNFLETFLDKTDETDAVIITSDHGNDPTTPSTDHSREYVPLLFYRKKNRGKNLGVRETFSDAAKTAAEFFGIKNSLKGKSFLNY
jgi:phosphopentomutase